MQFNEKSLANSGYIQYDLFSMFVMTGSIVPNRGQLATWEPQHCILDFSNQSQQLNVSRSVLGIKATWSVEHRHYKLVCTWKLSSILTPDTRPSIPYSTAEQMVLLVKHK